MTKLSSTELIQYISKQDVRIMEIETRGKQQNKERSNVNVKVNKNPEEIKFSEKSR